MKAYTKQERQILAVARIAWQEANARYFKNRLPRPRFYLADLSRYEGTGWHGYHEMMANGSHKIVLDRRIGMLDLCYTVPHEMIHQAQELARSPRTRREIHGRFFQHNHKRIFGYRYEI